jgi:hypothetical protein
MQEAKAKMRRCDVFTMFKTIGAAGVGSGSSVVPVSEWGAFLSEFDKAHKAWLTEIQTRDHETQETVSIPGTFLDSIELDLEDERHPRINLSVRDGNKIFKHILYEPSHLVWHTSSGGMLEILEIETVNTTTIVRFAPQR